MRKNYIIFITLFLLGVILLYWGYINNIVSYINLGFAGIYIALLTLIFSPPNMIDINIYNKAVVSYTEFIKNVIKANNLENYILFIPSYKNLPKGGMFIPKNKKNTKINLGLFDEKTFLLKNGLLITPPIGYNFIEDFEDYGEINLKDCELIDIISIASSVLKSYALLDSIDFKEDNDYIILTIENLKTVILDFPTPEISSIVFAISQSLNRVVAVENIEQKKNITNIKLKLLDKIENYLFGE